MRSTPTATAPCRMGRGRARAARRAVRRLPRPPRVARRRGGDHARHARRCVGRQRRPLGRRLRHGRCAGRCRGCAHGRRRRLAHPGRGRDRLGREGRDKVSAQPVRVLGRTPRSGRRPSTSRASRALALEPTQSAEASSDGSTLGDFFDTKGVSRVAGRAALALRGRELARCQARNAKTAGAAAVLISGTRCRRLARPRPDDAARRSSPFPGNRGGGDRRAPGGPPGVRCPCSRRHGGQPGLDAVAGFSSGGLSFDGRVKPDIVAPGVGLATFDPSADGSPRYSTVSGSSAAAAVAAGAAALVSQARNGLTAPSFAQSSSGAPSPSAATSR